MDEILHSSMSLDKENELPTFSVGRVRSFREPRRHEKQRELSRIGVTVVTFCFINKISAWVSTHISVGKVIKQLIHAFHCGGTWEVCRAL